MENQLTVKNLFQKEDVQKRFEQLLGKKAQGFITSVMQIVGSNKLLNNVDPQTVLTAAATAAALDLPINQNLGLAWIVPYKGQAQFQIGWRGLVQLAKRSGQYLKINVIEVYENQFKSFNRLTEELDADFTIDGEGDIIGYVAYFKELNGFEKVSFWSLDKVKKHASKYSQTYGKKNNSGKLIFSPWNDPEQFDAMCKKTVLKNTISQYGTLSIDMQTAQLADQAVQTEPGNYEYVDNEIIDIEAQNAEEENNRIIGFIEKAKTKEELAELEPHINSETADLFNQKKSELK